MIRPTPSIEFQADELARQFQVQLRVLYHAIRSGDEESALENVHKARRMLETVPLATDQYDVIVLRLNNCKRYLLSSERGAAAYELKLMAGTLELKKRFRKAPEREDSTATIVFTPVTDDSTMSRTG